MDNDRNERIAAAEQMQKIMALLLLAVILLTAGVIKLGCGPIPQVVYAAIGCGGICSLAAGLIVSSVFNFAGYMSESALYGIGIAEAVLMDLGALALMGQAIVAVVGICLG